MNALLILTHMAFGYSDIFSLGFGPFRWVCTSCESNDLSETDKIAAEVIEQLIASVRFRNDFLSLSCVWCNLNCLVQH